MIFTGSWQPPFSMYMTFTGSREPLFFNLHDIYRISTAPFFNLRGIKSIWAASILKHFWILKHFEVIYQTRERAFHQDIETPEVGWKNEAQPSFFDRLRGVWIPDETLFPVFDMASQTIHNSWSTIGLHHHWFMLLTWQRYVFQLSVYNKL